MLYESIGVKDLAEVRKVKEGNFWSIGDQSLCLGGSESRTAILAVVAVAAVLQLYVDLLDMDLQWQDCFLKNQYFSGLPLMNVNP